MSWAQKWPSSPSTAMLSVIRGKGDLPLCCSSTMPPRSKTLAAWGHGCYLRFLTQRANQKARKVSISSRRGPLSIFQRGGRSTPLSNPSAAMAALMGMGLTWKKSACIRGEIGELQFFCLLPVPPGRSYGSAPPWVPAPDWRPPKSAPWPPEPAWEGSGHRSRTRC